MKAVGLLLAMILDIAIPKLVMGINWIDFIAELNGGKNSTLAWIMIAVMLVVIGIGLSVPDKTTESTKIK